MSACMSHEDLNAVLRGYALAPATKWQFETHLSTCDACRHVVASRWASRKLKQFLGLGLLAGAIVLASGSFDDVAGLIEVKHTMPRPETPNVHVVVTERRGGGSIIMEDSVSELAVRHAMLERGFNLIEDAPRGRTKADTLKKLRRYNRRAEEPVHVLIWGDAKAVREGARGDGAYNWQLVAHLSAVDVATRSGMGAPSLHTESVRTTNPTELHETNGVDRFEEIAQEAGDELADVVHTTWNTFRAREQSLRAPEPPKPPRAKVEVSIGE